jgi:dTDP-4-amino-4,6-dideoxy-D-galactose acyltransferase
MIDAVSVSPTVQDRCEASRELLDELSLAAEQVGFSHLTYRPPTDDWDAIHGAERAGFLLIDLGVDFILRPDQSGSVSIDPALRPSRDEDIPALRYLAGKMFVHSRFGVDPFFSRSEVERFHEQWVTNLHNGLAQAVFVSEHEGEVIGFVSCSLQGSQGRIPLIGVSNTHRRAGTGSALVRAAVAWLTAAGASEIRVKTQATNVSAVRLYERNGFVLDRPEVTFSKALRRRP